MPNQFQLNRLNIGLNGRNAAGIALTSRLMNMATFTRASTARDTDASGNVSAPYAVDVQRTSQTGTLLEGASQNLITNPRGDFAVAPSFPQATMPIGWPGIVTGGVPSSVVGSGTLNGIPYVDVRFQGTAADTGARNFLPLTAFAATIGDTYATSVYVALVGGSFTNVSVLTLRCSGETGGTTFTPNGTLTRQTNIRTLTGATANVLLRWNYNDTVTPVDFTLRVGGWQCEKNNIVSSLMLPATGTQVASSRAADLLSLSGSVFTSAFGTAAAGCVILDINVPAVATAAAALLEFSDNTYANRFFVYTPGGSPQVQIVRFLAGASTFGGLATGNLVAGTTARIGIRWDGTNGLDICVNGNAVTNMSGAIPATTRLQLGNLFDGSTPLQGRLISAYGSKVRPADTSFVAACTLGANVETILNGPPLLPLLTLSANTTNQQALAGTSIGSLTGLTTGSTRTLTSDAGGRVALSGDGSRLVVGLTASVLADGPLSVTVTERLGSRSRATTFSITVANYDSAATTLLAAMTVQPSAAVAGAYDRAIRSLKSAGLWTALDVLYMPCHDSQSSRVNWKLPGTYTAAITGTVDFQAFQGHKSDGSTGYVGSAFNPSTNGAQFTANNCIVGWHCYPDFTAGVPGSTNDTNFDVGCQTGQLRVQARAGGSIGGRVNSANTGAPLAVSTSIGLAMLMRRDASTTAASKDGVAATALSNAGAGSIASGTLFWCGNVVAANYSSRRIGCVFLGRAFTDAECAAFKLILETYFREVGTWVDENTRGPALLSTNSASYASMSSQVIPDVAVIGTRRFRANYGVHGQPPGTSGEGVGAYNRLNYSDDNGQTYNFGAAWVSQTPASESVIDPHITALPDGRLLLVSPYNGSGGQRSIWGYVLTNPLAAPGSWVWLPPAFLGYGFNGSAYIDGPDLMFTQNNPLLGITGDGDYYCRLTFAGGVPVSRTVSLMPNAIPSATLNDYGERILARRPDGSLFCAFRVQSTSYYYSTSTNEGGTWTAAAAWSILPNPSSRMATALSPAGNRFVAGNNSTNKRENLTLWQLAPDMLSVLQTYLLDGRGSVNPRVSYPGISFGTVAGSSAIFVDHDCGRGNQDSPIFTNELLAHVVPEGAFVTGSPSKTTYTVTS